MTETTGICRRCYSEAELTRAEVRIEGIQIDDAKICLECESEIEESENGYDEYEA
jgi:ribosomal protein L40E